jgi:hypothetical protein
MPACSERIDRRWTYTSRTASNSFNADTADGDFYMKPNGVLFITGNRVAVLETPLSSQESMARQDARGDRLVRSIPRAISTQMEPSVGPATEHATSSLRHADCKAQVLRQVGAEPRMSSGIPNMPCRLWISRALHGVGKRMERPTTRFRPRIDLSSTVRRISTLNVEQHTRGEPHVNT